MIEAVSSVKDAETAQGGLTIAEVADRTGLSAHTLRYYERAGLFPTPSRAGNGHRSYSDRDVSWIDLLTRLRATGMPIAAVRRYARLAREGSRTAAERKALLVAHREGLLAQLAELRADLDLIEFKIQAYEDQVQQLPFA